MKQSIEIMKNNIVSILKNNNPSIYLFGSVVLDDFKLGWSDIDLLCLTKSKISDTEASKLLNLRQELLKKYTNNVYFRSFEGGMLAINEFINNRPSTVVYWGTSGQRITNQFTFDSFSRIELIEDGFLLYGNEVRNQFNYPSKESILKAVIDHYQTIRRCAGSTGRSLYSAGWFLNIARCIYTLRTGKIIAKTMGGKWALDHNLVPNPEVIEKVISIRQDPNKYKEDKEVTNWLGTLGPYIQSFADVLEKEISETI
ncbi:nucleotidyltransferase domain-containing protein [Haloplasma contractile]|uniref:Nucleotidyltransferase domain protein n=1 Tax=Haloplasma contractile SSD-17B TaxID=1033810 RepID=U2FQE9_9MOLU|nr:nucleotidyltransferase domain-containing protein [Haloplasma contractile]ERJ13259.1 Nucleotidyltransferase domain protein [Haloplasma contractile SSD-17B]